LLNPTIKVMRCDGAAVTAYWVTKEGKVREKTQPWQHFPLDKHTYVAYAYFEELRELRIGIKEN